MLTNTREGWGLTTDGKKLYLSDGSSSIYVMDGDTFEQQGKIKVKLDGKPVRNLNELEWIDGRIWANVYTEDYIVIIDPSSGNVTGVVDCRGLLPDSLRSADTDVLNGIARNDVTGEIYLTGKLWPRMYRVKLEEKK
jgi:glutamine cyclotransferase